MHKNSDWTLSLQNLRSWFLSLTIARRMVLCFLRPCLKSIWRQTTSRKSDKHTEDKSLWVLTTMMLLMQNIWNGKRAKEILSQTTTRNFCKRPEIIGSKHKYSMKSRCQHSKNAVNLYQASKSKLIKETLSDALYTCKTSIQFEWTKKSTLLSWIY